ncbi:aminotransferase class IV [Oscillatoria salina]|uniref:aminotransferase class IV n=1 Tax=Oscillatoria salina TaxID=331517 RepID=UPI0013B9A435|nr:aminotransferase class IV [Oscillatoria salina]MBZ8181974.1 branched chain amino acid aminotransferase [Oscillatoria salina IIICB1]NET89328.1 branched chain amino acid aminotransferase [Kamptonema sp. SIO1D9]
MFEVVQLVWHNGKIIPREQAAPSIASHSLHLGIGVFDGLRAFWNGDRYYIHALDDHLTRLQENARTLEMEIPWSLKELKAGIWTLLAEIPQTNYYLRPIVYRGLPKITIKERQKMKVDVSILAVTAPRDVIKPFRCQISPFERVSSRAIPVRAKICGAYVNSYLVRIQAEASGFDEGIMLDREGKITEAATANLFFIQEDTVVTPALTPDIFPGITRSTLLKVASSLGIKVIERDIYPEALGDFQAVFSCATFSEVRPIITIDSHQYDSLNNPIFRKFLKAYQEITYQ